MKNVLKLIGIIALVAVIGFSFAACDNGTGGGGNGTPSTPTNVTAVPYASGIILIRFNKVSNATEYKIYDSPSLSGTYNLLFTIDALDFYGDVFVQQLNHSTTYYFKVSATNSYGESPQSAAVSVTTYDSEYPAMPNTPTGVTATAASSTSITISWTEVPNVTGYIVWRMGNGNAIDEVGNVTTTSHTDTGLSPNTSYSYMVQAYTNTPIGSANPTLVSSLSEVASATTSN